MPQAETEPTDLQVHEVPMEGDQLVKFGDWEGKASDLSEAFISQGSLQQMREKDKAEIEEQVEVAKGRLAQQYQAHLLQLQQQQVQPQGQQQQESPPTLDALYSEANTNHSGYMHVDQVRGLVDMIQREFAARDKVLGALGHGLDNRFGELSGNVDKITTTHADREWDGFVDTLHADLPKWPRSTVSLMASGFEAKRGETPDQLRDGIRQSLMSEYESGSKHRADYRKKEREREREIKSAGLPGSGGQGVPSQKLPAMRTADEITNHFGSFDEPSA